MSSTRLMGAYVGNISRLLKDKVSYIIQSLHKFVIGLGKVGWEGVPAIA